MSAPDELANRISAIFDAPYYLAKNPDVAQAGVIPLAHYLEFGWKELRDPSPWFSVSWYLRFYPDIAAAEVEPLGHYLSAGAAEGRSPTASFDSASGVNSNCGASLATARLVSRARSISAL